MASIASLGLTSLTTHTRTLGQAPAFAVVHTADGGVFFRRGTSGCGPKESPDLTGCVETRGSDDPGPLFLWGSGETGSKTGGANQIDCSQDVVGEYAERG